MPTSSTRIVRSIAFGAGLIVASTVIGGEAAADIVQWTDADGVVHFTNRPTSNPNAKVYMKGSVSAPAAARAGVVPFAPQDRDLSRYARYDEHIKSTAALYQIPEQLVRAVIKVESDYDPRAVSVVGARGLMQPVPLTLQIPIMT